LIDNHYIEEITDYGPAYLRLLAPDTLVKSQSGDSSWESMVPPEVVQIIKERGFFGYHAPAAVWVIRSNSQSFSFRICLRRF
jgi:hypothetical protein